MQTVNLSQALRHKNRIIERMRKLEVEIARNNCVVGGTDRQLDVEAAFSELQQLHDHLVRVKLDIEKATDPIREPILRIGEACAMINFLRQLDTRHGHVRQVGGSEIYEFEYDSALTRETVEAKIRDLEAQLDELQQRIDRHNHTTVVGIDPSILRRGAESGGKEDH